MVALPTRARLSFPHYPPLPLGSLYKPLSLLYQKADGKSKKNHNPTAARSKIASQEVNQDAKAEGFVHMKGQDKNPEKQ